MTASRNQLIIIEGKTVQKIEYQEQPVVTLAMVDDLHGKGTGQARVQFNKNRNRLELGIDYFVANSNEGRAITGSATPNGDPRWSRVGLYHFDVLNECFVPTM